MIYFLKANERVKIGYSHDPANRVQTKQTSCPYELEVLMVIDGSEDEEHKLHSKFSNYRRSGEWFEFAEQIKQFINDNSHQDRKYEFGLAFNSVITIKCSDLPEILLLVF